MADTVVLPGGGGHGPHIALLAYPSLVAGRRGASVHPHEWPPDPPDPYQPETESWVRDQVARVVDGLGGPPLVIGKSYGTLAAGLAAERALPAIWMTPLLRLPWVVESLTRATAPFLLVGGTTDDHWDGAAARRLTPHVLEVAGAHHGMYVPGPVADSVAVLGRVVTAVEEFLDTIGWPPPTHG